MADIKISLVYCRFLVSHDRFKKSATREHGIAKSARAAARRLGDAVPVLYVKVAANGVYDDRIYRFMMIEFTVLCVPMAYGSGNETLKYFVFGLNPNIIVNTFGGGNLVR